MLQMWRFQQINTPLAAEEEGLLVIQIIKKPSQKTEIKFPSNPQQRIKYKQIKEIPSK